MEDIKVYTYSDTDITISLYDADNNQIDLSSYDDIVFVVADKTFTRNILFTRKKTSGHIVNVSGNTFTLILTKNNTTQNVGEYLFSIYLIDGTKQFCVYTGTILFSQSVKYNV